MIPYPYNMVDMGGIDLAKVSGTVVDGLYDRIIEAANACGDLVFYNWKFAEIEIAPQHTTVLMGNPITINNAIQVTEQDVVTVHSVSPDPPDPPEPPEPPEPKVLIPLSVTDNGMYLPEDYEADGFSSVDVDVDSSSYPAVDSLVNGSLKKYSLYGANLESDSIYVDKFLNDYARVKYGSTKGTINGPGQLAQFVDITASILQSDSTFKAAFPLLSSAEYYDYVYNKTAMIEDLGLVLLGDFSQTGQATGNTLLDSITNYSAVLLQGIYQNQRTSGYNTTMLYINPSLNVQYWTGMKDRNGSYDCYVTFTDINTVSLSGNRQVIIYGMP